MATIVSTARRHWAILLVLTALFVILAPTVARLGLHSDDYCFVYASVNHDFDYFVQGILTAQFRPFYAFAVYHIGKLFALNQLVVHLTQFALHIRLCVLLYALCLRLQRDRGMASRGQNDLCPQCPSKLWAYFNFQGRLGIVMRSGSELPPGF